MKKLKVEIDEKGRMVLPKQIRQEMNLKKEATLIFNENSKETIILPEFHGNFIKIEFTLEDKPGSLAKIATELAKKNIDLISTESQTLEQEHVAKWNVTCETSKFQGDLKVFLNGLKRRKIILNYKF